MKHFDFYEFAGLIVPGTTLLVALVTFFPSILPIASGFSVNVGEVAVGAVLAYGTGHVVQAFGNLLEAAWWKVMGGMPSDWVGKGVSTFLHSKQLQALPSKIAEQLRIEGVTLNGDSRWSGITRQAYAAVSASGRANRIDIFNGNYGLCRGLAASFFVVMILIALQFGYRRPDALALATAAFLLSGWRAHRFGVHYARELFVQFLQLPPREAK